MCGNRNENKGAIANCFVQQLTQRVGYAAGHPIRLHAGWVDTTTDPRGIVSKRFYDNLGQVTKTVEAYDGGAITNNTNKTTEFTYDGDGHMLTLQADLVGGAFEQTKWIYGVSTGTSDSINSNDVLKKMQYPDKTTGNPSSSEQETYTVNALGQM